MYVALVQAVYGSEQCHWGTVYTTTFKPEYSKLLLEELCDASKFYKIQGSVFLCVQICVAIFKVDPGK